MTLLLGNTGLLYGVQPGESLMVDLLPLTSSSHRRAMCLRHSLWFSEWKRRRCVNESPINLCR